ncbi:MAG: bifunctional folylpolyglutamate synthase/dihydrofolate synthase [Mucilaginibacter polytrichastri]|nr:bifunctional folylpolyglutamate synthase/dihydrofolate synthase [Mucilaginibacter polytrichastri]
MNYSETISYLYARLPMFSRVGASAIKKDLTNTIRLCAALGDPQNAFRSVHVAGTNGKGSVSHMLAAVYQAAGYKTGLYTSPHLKDFRERIRVNGQMIPENEVVRFAGETRGLVDEIEPSFFELTVAMAFAFFARENVDIAIIETGLGGRLDSTNVITPLLSVITNIGHDHMDLLGDTPQKIAAEKAGIIKPGVPVIISEKQDDVAGVFLKKAGETGSPLRFASEEWQIYERNLNPAEGFLSLAADSAFASFPELDIDLTGLYQIRNTGAVLSAVFTLQNKLPVDARIICEALRNVKGLTGLQGRWQTLSADPLIIADTGHNPEGIAQVMENLARVSYRNLHIVIGMVSDKDQDQVLRLLPEKATYYFCRPDIPRGLDAAILQKKAAGFGLHGNRYSSVSEALESAKKHTEKGDLIFVGGSTFVVAEVV